MVCNKSVVLLLLVHLEKVGGTNYPPLTLEKWTYMGVSKNRGIPKWMVYNGKSY